MSPEKLADLYDQMAITARDMAEWSRRLALMSEAAGDHNEVDLLWRSVHAWTARAHRWQGKKEQELREADRVR